MLRRTALFLLGALAVAVPAIAAVSTADCDRKRYGECSKKCGVGYRVVTSICGAKFYNAEETCCNEPCTIPEKEPNPVSMTVTCDNKMRVYVDGVLAATSVFWKHASTVHIEDTPALVAIHCVDEHVVGGILAHFSNGEGSDSSWKCSGVGETGWQQRNFNDSHWGSAFPIVQYPNGIWKTVSGMTGNPYWIWTNGWRGQNKEVFCRKIIGGSLTIASQLCRDFPPFINSNA